jgi:hypothetical protein
VRGDPCWHADEDRADCPNCVWLARHGTKQPESGACNWKLQLEVSSKQLVIPTAAQ